ncbi:serine protease [Methylobacterium soli]|uniref:Serine protease n=1 Tax=Methylobacterium soli TaxID=553447 RepID=A0A6L3SNU1_9HYPH|nr:serine protease [Methylobacterium soli]KAB1070133.1 serine protease [Methylobacterium soli]GJE44314.1 hypothetical protein AEGHOMDF_3502 [Methylobacterium soli]
MALRILVATLFLVFSFARQAQAADFLGDIIRNAIKSPNIARELDKLNAPALGNKQLQMNSKSQNSERPTSPTVNGRSQLAPIEAYPWVVAITNGPSADNAYYCAGVAIAEDWIATTAYCAANFHQRSGSVLVGEADFRKAKSSAVDKVVIHPEWNQLSHTAEIALLRLSPSPNLKLVPLIFGQGRSARERVGAVGQVLGWGYTNLEADPASLYLLKLLPTRILSEEVCSSPSFYSEARFEGQFCAQSLDRLQEACVGFGGSPLVLNNSDGQRYLAGLVGWGEGCPPSSTKPTVYVDVSAYSDWIRNTTGGAK